MKNKISPTIDSGRQLSFSSVERLVLFVLAFATAFGLYLTVLAPGVTFEDSGELITAAYALGIPHEPGYPLFTLIGKLFTFLPLGDIAYRVNMASAFFSALGAAWVSLIVLELATLAWRKGWPNRPWSILIVAWSAAIVVATGRSYISQAVITEVYGLNNFFTGLLLWLLIRWYATAEPASTREEMMRERYFYLYCFFSGLTITNHHTSAVFLLLGGFVIVMVDRTYVMDARRWMGATACVILGCLPYLYLPLSSVREPVMDWGNPENWTNFWRVVGRHQYGLDVGTTRTLKVLASQIGLHYELLIEQFTWPFIAAGLAGLSTLWARQRRVFLAVLVFNLLTGPLVAYVTNVNVTGRDALVIAEQRALVSVMYLPFYICWGAMAGLGCLAILAWVARRFAAADVGLPAIVVAGTIWFASIGIQREDMSAYRFPQQFIENLERQLEPNSIVLANWDPFAFPVMYFQHVERRAPQMIFVDVELLRRSWYIHMLQRWYPEFMAACRTEVDAFLSAVRPFEEGTPYDPNFIQQRFLAMIQSMIDRHIERRPVYVTVFQPIRPLEPGMIGSYVLESHLIAQRVRPAAGGPIPVDDSTLDLDDLTDQDIPKDRMANMLRNYYAIRFAERAALTEGRDMDQANRLYLRSLELVESAPIRRSIQQRYEFLQKKTSSSGPATP